MNAQIGIALMQEAASSLARVLELLAARRESFSLPEWYAGMLGTYLTPASGNP